jgi:hypothetical protein
VSGLVYCRDRGGEKVDDKCQVAVYRGEEQDDDEDEVVDGSWPD